MDDALQHRRDDVAASRISSDRVAEIVLKLVATEARVERVGEEFARFRAMAARNAAELVERRAEVELLRGLLIEALDAFGEDLSDERTRDRIRRDAGLL